MTPEEIDDVQLASEQTQNATQTQSDVQSASGMKDVSLELHDVFSFSDDETNFWPTPEFAAALKAAHCPLLVMLVGNGRTGKSTRAGQLLHVD
jgi:hypothetical protein